MFNRVYPVIDRPGGGRIQAWIPLLEKIAADCPADALYIFGHAGTRYGTVGLRADLLILRDYLPGFPEFHQALPNRLGANLGAAYDELTG